MQKPDRKRYLNEGEVTGRGGPAVPTLRNHRHLGKGIPYIKLGRRVFYDVHDVDEYMEKHKIVPVL